VYTECAYCINIDFEWDHKKAERNLKKHSVDFADAVSIFDDLNAITFEDLHEQEQRFISIALDCFARVLVVVYTLRGDIIRIVSARKATKREQRQYEVGI
jgi:uncharacterized protein